MLSLVDRKGNRNTATVDLKGTYVYVRMCVCVCAYIYFYILTCLHICILVEGNIKGTDLCTFPMYYLRIGHVDVLFDKT